MSWFSSNTNRWEADALITISAQIAAVERKLNVLLRHAGRDEYLGDLSKQLESSTNTLAASVEAAKKQQKEE